MKKILFGLALCLASAGFAKAAPPAGTVFNVRDFGVSADGKTPDNVQINKAIDAAAATNGGGTVYFPAGRYASYSIRLKSHVSLYLDQGAVIVAAPYKEGKKGYDEPEPNEWGDKRYQDFGHSHFHNSLIWGENLEDISIMGPGMIFGEGLTREQPEHIGEGNKAIALKLCRNVTLKDFTILLGGHMGMLLTGCDNMTIENIKEDTNRDGMDIDACRNVRVANCTVNSPWDDAICLKASYALGYARATENVTITNCQVSGFDRGTFLNGTYQTNEGKMVPDRQGPTGRIKMGTEGNGGFKGITITNCVFQHCRGLALETVDGGSLEDVTISNIVMRDLTNGPFFLRLGARMRGPAGVEPGHLRRVNISDVMVYNADSHFSSLIMGIPGHDVEDVKLNNIRIYYRQIDSPAVKIQKQVAEYTNDYPEPQRFGVMPAYGFFIRHAAGIEMNNVQVSYLGQETRPAIILEDVKGITLNNVKAQPVQGQPTIIQRGVTNPVFNIGKDVVVKTEPVPATIPDPPPYKHQN